MLIVIFTFLFFFVTIQLLIAFRVNKLYWKNIYRSQYRPGLKLLRDAFANAGTEADRSYVKSTIYLYKLNLVNLLLLVLLLLGYFIYS